MKSFFKTARIGKMIVFGILAIAGLAVALMLLWNWLMPVIFGLTVISFWQALGLLALSKILFGKGHRPNWQNREKFNRHREQFMTRFGKRSVNEDEEQRKESSDDEK